MKQYQELLTTILDSGTRQKNRTGIDTFMIPGYMMKFDLRQGFPALTTKKLAFKSMVGELLAFLRGANTVKQFNDLGCKFWDANGSAPAWVNNINRLSRVYFDEEGVSHDAGDLGRIYGVQWRDWLTNANGDHLDQLENLLSEIKTNPTSRRLIVSAWRPDELTKMALPPCHYSFQVIIEQESKTMHLLWNQRSCDVFLGIPMNIASYAILLHVLARITGYNVGTLTGFLADVHIYENHLAQVKEQLLRNPYDLPHLKISDRVVEGTKVEDIKPEDIELVGYECHAAIKAEMAV
jgi:thymidylate synthase